MCMYSIYYYIRYICKQLHYIYIKLLTYFESALFDDCSRYLYGNNNNISCCAANK